MRLATPLSEALGLASPLIQAPMAGGPSSKELVAACSAAGALGSFGFAYTQPEEMKKQSAWVRAKTSRPFGINLFTAAQPASIDAGTQRGALDAVAGYFRELGLPAPEPVSAPYAPDLNAQLDAVENISPRVFTVHLSDLPEERLKRLKARKILVGGSATCVAEAQRLESLGFDFVIAQGGEAGGHRGSYLRDPYASLTGTLALVRLVVRAVHLPVVAAGGIMDGAGIAAALALGAQAAQLGTAFIPCPESGAPQIHKDLLLKEKEDNTRLTEKFSGKPARGLANRFIVEMAGKDAPQLAFPAQNSVTGRLRQASAKAGKPDFVALWAGQAAPLARALPAASLIEALNNEAIAAIRTLASSLKE
ncbi:MAG TPA: nitronate monooxygenase [Burkholderiales bacterium]|nr:nitronate monooxygenase [Burkholderiales bacterium]